MDLNAIAASGVVNSIPVAANAATAQMQPITIAIDSLPATSYFKAFVQIAPVIIAVAVAWVTYVMQKRQAAIAHRAAEIASNKLKLELFEKRWPVYEGAQKLIDRVFVHAQVDDDTIVAYFAAIAGAKWIFNDEIEAYLQGLYKSASELNWVQANRRSYETDDAFAARASKFQGLMQRWAFKRQEFDALMEPFLRLRDGTTDADAEGRVKRKSIMDEVRADGMVKIIAPSLPQAVQQSNP